MAVLIIERLKHTAGEDASLLITPFIQLPSKEELPDYYEFIANPMDVDAITNKLDGLQYQTIEAFEADVNTMWENAKAYNTSSSQA